MTVSRGFWLDRSLVNAFYLFHAPRFFRVKRMGMDLDWTDFDGMVREWHLWESTYIPAGGLNGKTVLDIGACCGGTPYLFFLNGAKKVIAIERDPERVKRLEHNRERFGWEMEIIPRAFEPSDLDIRRDFTKCDIEGYEMRLLENQTKIGPCSLEAHNWFVHDCFKKIGFRALTTPNPMMGFCVMGNW